MHFIYFPKCVCSQKIEFDIDNGVIHNASFVGGCNGNLKAISKLVENKEAKEVAKILLGNTCGSRSTSCADQFAKALLDAINKIEH